MVKRKKSVLGPNSKEFSLELYKKHSESMGDIEEMAEKANAFAASLEPGAVKEKSKKNTLENTLENMLSSMKKK